MKSKTLNGFGHRLATIRQAKGRTQTELGTAVGVSQRVIAYYETESTQPPGALLVALARALSVSTDELLGMKPSARPSRPKPPASSNGSAASKSSPLPISARS